MNTAKKLLCLGALVLGDIFAFFISFMIAFFLREQVLSGIPAFHMPVVPLNIQLSTGFLKGAIILLLIISYEKLYIHRLSFWEETRILIKGITLSFILIMTMVFLFKTYTQTSRTVIVLAWIISLFVFPIVRLLVKKILARSGLWRKRILILGTGRTAQHVAREILRNDTLGYTIEGFLSEEGGNVGQKLVENIPVVGTLQDMERIIAERDVRDVVVALSNKHQHKMIRVVTSCEPFVETIKVVPSIGSVFASGVRIDELGEVLALSVPRNLVKPWNIFIKRGFEFIFSLVLLLLLAPLFLMIIVALKIDSRGPIMFSQKRLGRGRKEFRIFKFRSMHLDREARLEEFLGPRPEVRKEWEKYQKLRDYDPRVTRVGKFLRTWSLDELPQLVNVLKGDMSLIGPRPYLPREIYKFGPKASIIFQVKPGLTGLWQVRGRSIRSFEERQAFDEFYIRNWSLWLDIIILLQTLRALARREGAF